MILTFKHPQFDYTEDYDTSMAWLWCLLFGCVYWLVRRNFVHAIIWWVLVVPTVGISILVYPFFANKINLNYYARNGWTQLPRTGASS